jgi:hypothetical protein
MEGNGLGLISIHMWLEDLRKTTTPLNQDSRSPGLVFESGTSPVQRSAGHLTVASAETAKRLTHHTDK